MKATDAIKPNLIFVLT